MACKFIAKSNCCKIFFIFYFYLAAAPWPTLGYYQEDNLTQLMLITVKLSISSNQPQSFKF